MTARLGPLDAAFWNLESARAPMHLGALACFGPGAVDPAAERLASLVAGRAAAQARFRRRVEQSWNPLDGPLWVEDADFDASRHVILHRLEGGLDRPGLERTAAAVMASPLDRARAPWEIHLLTSDRPDEGFALLAKIHHAAVDGLRAVELGVRLMDEWQQAGDARTDRGARVDPVEDGGGALAALMRLVDPRRPVDVAVQAVRSVPAEARRMWRTAEIATDVATALRSGHAGFRAGPEQDRVTALPVLDLDEVHRIRKAHGGTVHDVVLSVIAGALRIWLGGRGVAQAPVRVLVPVSHRSRPGDPGEGNQLSGFLVELPVAEADPVRRLELVREAMRANKARGPRRGPGAVALLTGAVPAGWHRVIGPLLRPTAPLLFDALVTSVPMPDIPFHLGGAPLTGVYPLAPLAPGQALAVAVSTYRGTVNVGLHGLIPPGGGLDGLADALETALAELLVLV